MAKLFNNGPVIFRVAETKIDVPGINDMMSFLGVEDWDIPDVEDSAVLSEIAGKSCYMSFDTKLNQNLTRVNTRANTEYLQDGIIGHKHGSVLEHSSVSLFIADVSRVVTHELVRHRAGTAFSQLSGRYVRTDATFYVPDCIRSSPEATARFFGAIKSAREAVSDLEAILGVDSLSFAEKKKVTSAIRRITGNGQSNSILLTANHRAWRHMIEVRTSEGAEEEIRLLFVKIAYYFKEQYPAIYDDMEFKDSDTGIQEVTFRNSKV